MVQEWLRVHPTLWETCMEVGFPLKMQVPSSMFVQFSHTDPYPINNPHTSALKTSCSQVPQKHGAIGGHSCYLRPQPEGMVLRKKPEEDAPIPWRPEFDLFSAWGKEEEQHPRQWFSGHQNHPQTFACHINRKVLYNFFICKLHLKQLLQQMLHLPVMPPCKQLHFSARCFDPTAANPHARAHQTWGEHQDCTRYFINRLKWGLGQNWVPLEEIGWLLKPKHDKSICPV